MKKKGMELSLSTIIVAIIGIIVLVVIAFLFVQRSSIFGKSLEGAPCDQRDGYCTSAGCDSDHYMVYTPGCIDPKTGKEPGPCCLPIERG